MDDVDWSPVPPDVGAIKLALIDDLSARLETMGLGVVRTLGPIADASACRQRNGKEMNDTGDMRAVPKTASDDGATLKVIDRPGRESEGRRTNVAR